MVLHKFVYLLWIVLYEKSQNKKQGRFSKNREKNISEIKLYTIVLVQ